MTTALRTLLLLMTLTLVAGCSDAKKIDGYGYQSTSQPGEDSPKNAKPDTITPQIPPTASTEAVTPSAGSTANQTASPSGFTSKVKIKGRDNFSIKPMDDGAKLVDGAEAELARYNIREGLRVKIKDSGDKVLGQIKGDASKIHIEDAQGQRIFALQRQADGDYKLENASGELIYKIKKRDYGLKIEDASEAEVAKVKTKSGKTSLRNASDTTLLSTKGRISAMAMACLGFSELDQPLRVGLAIRMQAEEK